MQKTRLTKEGLTKLQIELEGLRLNKRPKAVNRLKTARSMGDLSENSEYSAAKEDLAFVEGRIQEIEELLKNVEIVENHLGGSQVILGATIITEVNGIKEELQIVGEFEADPMNKKLSEKSPIGKALIGKRVGEIVEVTVPAGKSKYKILEIK